MRLWLQRSALAMAIVLALVACAADGGTPAGVAVPSDTSDSTTTSQASSSTTDVSGGGEGTTSTPVEVTDPPPQVEGPAAPDFTFAMADGSAFSLSDEQKPVYLVFWAEW
jgi:hypothetical protein